MRCNWHVDIYETDVICHRATKLHFIELYVCHDTFVNRFDFLLYSGTKRKRENDILISIKKLNKNRIIFFNKKLSNRYPSCPVVINEKLANVCGSRVSLLIRNSSAECVYTSNEHLPHTHTHTY